MLADAGLGSCDVVVWSKNSSSGGGGNDGGGGLDESWGYTCQDDNYAYELQCLDVPSAVAVDAWGQTRPERHANVCADVIMLACVGVACVLQPTW